MTKDLTALLPVSKFDTAKAEELVTLGFPEVEPVLPQILEWLQDLNWPVAAIFRPFLVRVGQPIAPFIRDILSGSDDGWKYCVLNGLVGESAELAHALRPELKRLAANPTQGELTEEVNHVAIEILSQIDGAAEV